MSRHVLQKPLFYRLCLHHVPSCHTFTTRACWYVCTGNAAGRGRVQGGRLAGAPPGAPVAVAAVAARPGRGLSMAAGIGWRGDLGAFRCVARGAPWGWLTGASGAGCPHRGSLLLNPEHPRLVLVTRWAGRKRLVRAAYGDDPVNEIVAVVPEC